MKIENAIVCDEVRKEITGKHILIGVYQENLLVPQFPTPVGLVLWTQIRVDRNGTIPLEIRVQADKQTLATLKATLNVKDHTKASTLSTPKIGLEIGSACILSFQAREEAKKWKTLKKLNVDLQ